MQIANATSAIDADQLLERCVGNSALVAKLLKAFFTTLPVEKCSLQSAIEANDLSAIARISHKLKGTCSNMCANSLAEIAGELEQAAREGQFERIAQYWLETASQIDSFMDTITSPELNRS